MPNPGTRKSPEPAGKNACATPRQVHGEGPRVFQLSGYDYPTHHPMNSFCSRRHFIKAGSFSLSSLALAWLLREEGLLAAPIKPPLGPQKFDLTPKVPPLAPRAKAMISLFMMGGPSHIDLFDPKPEMAKYD